MDGNPASAKQPSILSQRKQHDVPIKKIGTNLNTANPYKVSDPDGTTFNSSKTQLVVSHKKPLQLIQMGLLIDRLTYNNSELEDRKG